MSWTDCMEKKIEKKYGDQVAECVRGISKDNLEDVAKCIVSIIGDAASWEEVLADLTAWSVECVF